jgi:hypothetical protein
MLHTEVALLPQRFVDCAESPNNIGGGPSDRGPADPRRFRQSVYCGTLQFSSSMLILSFFVIGLVAVISAGPGYRAIDIPVHRYDDRALSMCAHTNLLR